MYVAITSPYPWDRGVTANTYVAVSERGVLSTERASIRGSERGESLQQSRDSVENFDCS